MCRLIKEATYSFRVEQEERRKQDQKEYLEAKRQKELDVEEAARKQKEDFYKKQKEEGCFNCKEGHDFTNCRKVDGQGRRGSQEAWAVFRCPICLKDHFYQSNIL